MKFDNEPGKKNNDNNTRGQESMMPEGFHGYNQSYVLSDDDLPFNSAEFPMHGVEYLPYDDELPISNTELPQYDDEIPWSSAEDPLYDDELPISGTELPLYEEELPQQEFASPLPDIEFPEIEFPLHKDELPIRSAEILQYGDEFPLNNPELPVYDDELPIDSPEFPVHSIEFQQQEVAAPPIPIPKQKRLRKKGTPPPPERERPRRKAAPPLTETELPMQELVSPQTEAEHPQQDITRQKRPRQRLTKPSTTPPPEKKKKKEKHVYPDATLSDKQLEALQKVLGPEVDIKTGKRNSDQKTGKGKGSKKKRNMHDPLVIDDRSTYSLVRTVFLIIFIVLFISAAAFSGWYYWWTTHSTFEHELQPMVILEGQQIDPNTFLYPGEEQRGLSVTFQNPHFEPVVGLQYVQLTVKLGWRSVENAAALYVLEPVEYFQHEFKEEGAVLRPVEFLVNSESARGVPFDIRFAEAPLPLDKYEVGEYVLQLALNDAPFEVILKVVDTTPPTATGVAQEIRIGDEVFPEQFVMDIHDHSPISSVTFAEEPNIFARENQTVRIAIEDIFENVGTVSAELSILLNQMPPEITTTIDSIESEVGTTVDYLLSEVTAEDDFGRPLEVHVDDSSVNADEEGVYIAIYWAEDLSGNRTEADVVVYILSVAPEQIYEQVDEILGRIINDSMTDVQKVRHINDWIRWSIRGTTTESDTTSVLGGAHIALRDKQGDFNVVSALSSVMLTRAGIENMFIDRHPDAEGRHRWNLINPDGRGWYHFDAFPTGLGLGNGQMSRFTDKQAQDFANRIKMEDYYRYNADLYPEVVKE